MNEELETLEFEEQTKQEQLKCTHCRSFSYCRKYSISKGSVPCDENRGLREKKKKEPSDQAKGMGMLGYLMQKMGKK